MEHKKEERNLYMVNPAVSEKAKEDVGQAEKLAKDFLAVSLKHKKQYNNLLGEFDAKGKYSISDEAILEGLKKLPKKFQEKIDNVVYADCLLGEFVLSFKIVFDITPSFCNAYLYVVEIEEGEDEIKHTTLLDNILDVYSPKFREQAYEMWKVYLEEEVYDKDDYIYNLLKKQREEYLANFELFEILSQLYLLRMLKALENCGELGEEIINEYNQILQKLLQKNPSIAQDNIRLKFVLDGIISKKSALGEILKTSEGEGVVSGYINPMKKLMNSPSILQTTGNSPTEEKKKDEKKAAPKAKPKKKGKAKSASKPKPAKAFDIAGVFKAKSGGAKKEEKKKSQVYPSKLPEKPIIKSAAVPAPMPVEDKQFQELMELAKVTSMSAEGLSKYVAGKNNSVINSVNAQGSAKEKDLTL